MTFRSFHDKEIAALFANYPPEVKERLLALRELIFEEAAKHFEVGELEETLKWGQPSYLTQESKSGSTIRMDQVKKKPGTFAIYFNCQTTLIETFRDMFPKFSYEGNRAIHFNVKDKLPKKELAQCILMALTYHLNKNNGSN